MMPTERLQPGIPSEEAYALYLEGAAQKDRGEWREAASTLKRSLHLQLHFKTAQLLAECHLQLGERLDALIFAGFAHALNPRNDRSAVLFAEILLEAGDDSRAREITMHALQRNPDYGPAQRLLAALERTP
jgi:tetratricopeptide (TPR) repeat protein